MQSHFSTAARVRRLACDVVTLLVCFSFASLPALARFDFSPNIWKSDGDDHGLTDLKGHELVPATYAAIEYQGHGLFLLTHKADGDRFERVRGKTLINSNGRPIPLKLPSQTVLDHILWLGAQAQTDQKFVPEKMPEDALLVFELQSKYGICDGAGKIVLPATFISIGKSQEGTAILRGSAELYLFDVETKEQRKFDCDNPVAGSCATFTDGLAPMRKGNLWGFINAHGQFVIEPRYQGVSAFNNGQAYVSVFTADGLSSIGEIIDKSGKVISPPGLRIDSFYGDYAVAGRGTGKVGVVNRAFEFVIQPEYNVIIPEPESFLFEDRPFSSSGTPFYYASKNDEKPPVVLSINGKVLFSLPNELHFPNWPPRLQNGAIACPVGAQNPWGKVVYLNRQGQEVSEPYRNLSNSKSTTFREIAPGILLKTIECSDQDYQRELQWINPHHGNRFD